METTTETLFATLSPEAREEAIRLAARLQAQDGESVGLVAAARAAGIEDRFLREAVGRTSIPPVAVVTPMTRTSPAISDARAAGLLLLGATLVLSHASVRFGGWFLAYALAFLLPFALAALLPGRSRWLAPALVLVTGVIVHVFMSIAGGWPWFGAYFYLLRAVGIETLLAMAGAFVVAQIGASSKSNVPSAMNEPPVQHR